MAALRSRCGHFHFTAVVTIFFLSSFSSTVSDIAVFVLKMDVKLHLTNSFYLIFLA